MNNITIEFCPEDRARIDRLIEAMDKRSCDRCVENVMEAISVAHETAQPVTAAQVMHAQPVTPVPSTLVQPTPIPQAEPTATPVAPVTPSIPYEPYTPTVAPTAPVTPVVQPVTPTAPTAPNTVIPTGTVTYDMDTIARAGSALIDQNPANIAKLMELLAKYGTNAITTLDKAYYGAFVTDLRALGAQI